MKNIKKVFAVLFVLVLTLSMFATVASAANVNITMSEKGSYNAYKLMDATDGGSGKFAYSVNSKYLDILKAATGKTTDAAIVDYVAGLDADGIRAFADTVYTAIKTASLTADASVTSGTALSVAQGYWLIADVTANNGGYKANSLVMLDTAGNSDINITTKKDLPTVEKKIVEVIDSEEVEKDVADNNISDKVTFRLRGTVPENIDSFTKYYYEFHDKTEHFTYIEEYTVTIDGVDYTEEFTPTWNETNDTLDFVCEDILAITDEGGNPIEITPDTKVVVTYKATLDEDAVIGGNGNINPVYLEYSNDPYNYGTPDDSPSYTGETPEDPVVVFTYEIAPVKVDGSTKAKLSGAKFVLYRLITTTPENVEPASGQIQNMYNSITTKEYVALDANGKVQSWGAKANATTLESATDGSFKFSGLDAGTYYLEETNAPLGYRPLASDPVVVITATYKADCTIDSFAATVDGEDATATAGTGIVTFNIENNAGSILPSTGGMGTYVLYALGGLLVIGAFVFFIVRKRSSLSAD